MLEYYNKVLDGFEYCKTNLEHDCTIEQFQSCENLVSNYVNLCEYYINKQQIKSNKEYLMNVCQEKVDELSNMLEEWVNIYNLQTEKESIEIQKQSDIITNLNIQDEFIKQKENMEKIVVKGFAGYMKKKKKTKKKNG